MIPIRVTMSGWMRYRDETVAEFSGARLLSICGENGSGKSSIFDAITFALFGQHRHGTQHIEELISDGGDQCAVEFEFELEGKRYRVRRTRGRRSAQGSQGLWLWDVMAEDWATVPNTQYVRGLNAALAALIRITPTAFNSSFLLQQGAATEFLDATPAGRFSVVSSLVNLEQYQALEKKAREARGSESAEVQRLSTKLQEFDGVDAESLEFLRARFAQTTEQHAAAARELEDAKAQVETARTFARVKLEIDTAERQREAAAELLSEAIQIEANARRFESLDDEIESVRTMQTDLDAAAGAIAAAGDAQQRLASIDLDHLSATSGAAAETLAGAIEAVERSAAEYQIAATDERAAAEFLALASQTTALQTRLATVDGERTAALAVLDRLPDLEREAEHVRTIALALPLLQNLGRARQNVERIERDDPRGALVKLDAGVAHFEAELESAMQDAQATSVLFAQAQDEAARARAQASSLDDQVARRRDGVDEAVCSRCGQPVDPEHARKELDALKEQARAAERLAADASKAAALAQQSADESAARRDQVQDSIRRSQADRLGLIQRIEELTSAETAAEEARAQFFDAAPISLRDAVPANLPLTRVHEVYNQQKAAAGRREELDAELRRLHSLEGAARTAEQQIAQLSTDLARIEAQAGAQLALVPDAAALHSTAERRLRDAAAARDAARVEEKETRAADIHARGALETATEHARDLKQVIATQTQSADSHRRTAQRSAERLDVALRGRAMDDPRAVRDLLERERDRLAGAPERLAQLTEARRLHDRIGGVLAKLNEDLDRIPPAQRIDELVAREALDHAESILQGTLQALERCQSDVIRMERDLEAVESMRADLARAETRSQHLRRLEVYLGKTGLQGALVSEALETVTSHANAFLERLTGGTLVLHLERGDSDALELKAQDVTCMREARSVQALSGSQKFRCAVAIAAGIGQYAGAGGMRSIVIDEGFGSLDQQGQHLIIEELKNLAEHMDRVIVVSHLDTFSDRAHFPDQIRVIREGDRSRIERAS